MPEVILGREMQTNQIIPISDVERRSGLYILGRMGRGKTSLMTKLILKCCSNFVIKPIRSNKMRGCRAKIATKPENTGLHKAILIL